MRHIRWIVLVVFLIIVTLVAGSFLIRPSSEPSSNADKFGVCIHLSDFNAETEAAMVDLGAKWVRIDWIIGEMGPFLDRMSNDGINVLAIIDHNTMNHQAFTLEDWQANVLAIIASDEAKLVSAWEIWNEPNAQQFFFGYMDGTPEHYFDMLKVAYNVIKYSSSSPVISAGLAPIDYWETWLKDLYSLGAKDYCDIQGIHLYHDLPTNNYDMINSIKAYGKSVWITEIGRPSSPSPYSEVNQAEYLESNFKLLLSNAEKAFWYEMIDCVNLESEKENHFGLINKDHLKKSAYDKFQSFLG